VGRVKWGGAVGLEHRVLEKEDETGADITEIREALCVCVYV
jgi:hypothetical protein